jgi:hypothetical protein
VHTNPYPRLTKVPLPSPEHLGDCKEEGPKSDMAPLLRDVKHPEEPDHKVGEHGEVVDLYNRQKSACIQARTKSWTTHIGVSVR